MKGSSPIKLNFIKKDGTTESKEVHFLLPSNNVRKKLQSLHHRDQVTTLKFSKTMKENHPELWEMQNQVDNDLTRILELSEQLTPENMEIALEKTEELSELQNASLVVMIQTMTDLDRTIKLGKLDEFHLEQFNSALGETTAFEDIKTNDVREYDFWGEQDLEKMREERFKFFRRAGIGQT